MFQLLCEIQRVVEKDVALKVNDTVPIRVYERKRRKGNKGVHPDDETGLISCPSIADLDK